LGRILASETNVSDLLAYFTEEDPSPWTELLDVAPASVVREGRARTMKRADLQLLDADGETIGAVEVKLGHHLDQEQSDWYLETFDSDVPLVLATLDPDDAGDESTDPRWITTHLPGRVRRRAGCSNSEVAGLDDAPG